MGRVSFAGGCMGMSVPSTGIAVSTLAVGSIIKLIEGGIPKEWIVVNQGKPGNSSLYDGSCNGTWVMRKCVNGTSAWGSDAYTNYVNGNALHSYMNNTLYPLFDDGAKAAIKKVKVPYQSEPLVISSGALGFETWLFPIGYAEINYTESWSATDGAALAYFSQGVSCNTGSASRIAYDEAGAARAWFTRSCQNDSATVFHPVIISTQGEGNFGGAVHVNYVRPLAVLDFNTLVDATSLVVKGVA